MKKNRDYTGLARTPNSLSWLLRQRAIEKGQLDRFEKLLESLPAEIERTKAAIAQLDVVIPMHEIAVDPQVITGKQPRRPRLTRNGGMTKLIYQCLKQAGVRPAFTTEIATYFIRQANVDMTQITKPQVVEAIGDCLKKMCAAGRIHRHHVKDSGLKREGIWSLHPKPVDVALVAGAAPRMSKKISSARWSPCQYRDHHLDVLLLVMAMRAPTCDLVLTRRTSSRQATSLM